ncbi:hypothetical protein CGC56_07005 [Capnocytophaga canimorsus]|uniref:Uncharacterized protein n=1 Tax=Capnocytophaga canimorsus TaxID=28188 RepID=A0A250GC72_9FLAO|nr:hypothetical protein CGC56_07005 [Capnocytophaga canimorsus]ATA93968.1 hypothetical protein CGC54_06305 [Capnocytophaga canimorsus]
MKKRYWLLLFTVFWFSLLYFIDIETWIVLSYPFIVITFVYLLFTFIVFWYCIIFNKDPRNW